MSLYLKTIFLIVIAFAIQACSQEQGGIVEARSAVEDYPISAVTFRSMDDFFPVARVLAGEQQSALPTGRSLLSDDTPVDIGDGDISLMQALIKTDTNALLVIKDGQIVYEKYLNGSDASSQFVGWSMSKSIVSLLVGIAIEEGHINGLDSSVDTYWAALKGTAYEGVSMRHMLEMRAGVDYTEWSRFAGSDVDVLAARSLFSGEYRFTDFADLDLQRGSAPGEAFNYSTLTSSILGRVIEEATGTSLAEYTQQKLWQPAGMQSDAYWMLDGELPEGKAFGGGGFNAVMRDFARLGLMVLQKGRIGGLQIVPAEWIESSVRYDNEEPILPRTPRGYGYQWWTFVGTDIHEAVGIHGQFISIDPKTNTVIVKTSYWPGRGGGERENFLLFNEIRDAVSVSAMATAANH